MNLVKTMLLAGAAVSLSACAICQTAEEPAPVSCIDNLKADLQSNLSSEIEAGKVKVASAKGSSLKVTVSGDNNFDVGSANLSEAATELFASIGKGIAQCDKANVRVVGHTDSTGNPESNQTLSANRAGAVAGVLKSSGVAAGQVKQEGRASRDPYASNDTKEGKWANRRVEIIVSP